MRFVRAAEATIGNARVHEIARGVQRPRHHYGRVLHALLEELQEEDVDKVDVKPFSHDGVDYLKSSDGILYNPTSHDEVGVWSEALKTITPIEDDEESEDEEEDSEEEEDEESEEEDEESEDEGDDVVCA